MDDFVRQVWTFYTKNQRPMPWRSDVRPYYIVVSEIMLQQTQVDRVVPKFLAFIQQFPDFSSLATAPLARVLTAWQGLGYNRRARFLHELARTVVTQHGGDLPTTIDQLESLPGIGPATARSIAAFAFNQPVVFIETNIRSVYLHHFFADQTGITDAQLLPLIEQTLDVTNPREWYWALMDYGVWIKKEFGNPSRRSRHHTKQSTFAGSNRQKRGQIIRYLTSHPTATLRALATAIDTTPKEAKMIISALLSDGLIVSISNRYRFPPN